jgi:UDP-N-acetylmuramate--alanine ligase
MLPLALIMKERGSAVSGSDRGRDQGRTPERFAFLESQGIRLYPQDGSGVTPAVSRVVVSTAVEETIPDYRAALDCGLPIVRRAALLAELFNEAKKRVAVAGTSGKSTTTGMIGWILHQAGLRPTVMNGAVMKNFVTPEIPLASALVGDPDLFVSEVDESDGSIDGFTPTVAVLNNIALDHKTMDELRGLFSRFVGKAQSVIINLDNEETARLASPSMTTYSLRNPAATLVASDLVFKQDGVRFNVVHTPTGERATLRLPVVGRHNVSNALAAMGAAMALGVSLTTSAKALESFSSIARRMEKIGQAKGMTVYDDFAHNPDKIGASLEALHQFDGRLLILFQPHGFGPLKLMKDAFAAAFVAGLRPQDRLYVVDPLYLGGTVDRSVTSLDLTKGVEEQGRQAFYHPSRDDAAAAMALEAAAGDRLIIMGARDDTLPALAQALLDKVAKSL